MKPIPFFRLFLSLVSGISVNLFLKIEYKWVFYSLIALPIVAILAALLFYFTRNKTSKLIAGIFFLIAQFLLGFNLAHNTLNTNKRAFYANNIAFENATAVEIKIKQALRLKQNSIRTIAEVQKFKTNNQWFTCKGKVLVYWPRKRNKSTINFQPGTILIARNAIMDMPKAAFPYDFDFKAVMRYSNVQHQIFLDSTNFFVQAYTPETGLVASSIKTRNLLISTLDNLLPTDVSGLAQSLILGFKDNLEPTDSKAFAAAGTMHILAVSGLHVGMLYLILQFLLTFYKKNKTLFLWQSAIIVTALWIYAFITGLGPSVIRASLMLSILEIGRIAFKKSGNGINNLFASAYIQLIIFPLNVIEVGFQLSYLAVLGIMYFYPKISGLFVTSYWLPNKVYQLACVSIAATLGTLPVSIYFFHSFPIYFIFSNILLVPFGMLVLSALIILLSISWIPIISTLWAALCAILLKTLKMCVHFFAKLPGAQVQNLYLTEIEVVLILLVLPLATYMIYYKKTRVILPLTALLILFTIEFQVRYYQSKKQLIFICAELRNTPIASIINQNQLTTYSQPISKSLADSLFSFQKGLIKKHFIQSAHWHILTTPQVIPHSQVFIEHLPTATTLFQFPNKAFLFHWKARKNMDTNDHVVHIIQNRYLRWASTKNQYQVLKNNYYLYKFKYKGPIVK